MNKHIISAIHFVHLAEIITDGDKHTQWHTDNSWTYRRADTVHYNTNTTSDLAQSGAME